MSTSIQENSSPHGYLAPDRLNVRGESSATFFAAVVNVRGCVQDEPAALTFRTRHRYSVPVFSQTVSYATFWPLKTSVFVVVNCWTELAKSGASVTCTSQADSHFPGIQRSVVGHGSTS